MLSQSHLRKNPENFKLPSSTTNPLHDAGSESLEENPENINLPSPSSITNPLLGADTPMNASYQQPNYIPGRGKINPLPSNSVSTHLITNVDEIINLYGHCPAHNGEDPSF